MSVNRHAQAILRLDAGAACLAGMAVVGLHRWLARLYEMPDALVLFIGVANLVYGAYSGSLALRASRMRTPSRLAIEALALGNLAWALICVGLIGTHWRSASALAIATLAFEALFVTALARAEWRWVRPDAR